VRELIKVKLPYNLSQAAIALGEVALEHPEHTRRAVDVLRGRREQWRAALRRLERLELEVFPSEGNFLLVRSPNAARIRDRLRERGILVREVGHYPHLAGCLRFGVGSGPALRDTLAALEELAAEIERGPSDESRSDESPIDGDAVTSKPAPSAETTEEVRS